jgi:hypothetical protein
MHIRASLMATLLASIAGAGEPAAPEPVLTARSFDLSQESIRKIVRATAATQYGQLQPIDESAAEPRTSSIDVSMEETPRLERTAPQRKSAPQSQGPLSALVEALLDESDGPATAAEQMWAHCQQLGPIKSESKRLETCPDAAARNAQRQQ